eukprot:NODE_5724_length_1740_cov_9.951023.p1 GENE.NODE_5724_length_1740_cov_9.951023~~NODE_5724_length_1740_cov_9.951023.p1  ORF type:complete len:469 (-),score=167.43 NODE_5724_length_1740_cov_9.951023:279-1685(-)
MGEGNNSFDRATGDPTIVTASAADSKADAVNVFLNTYFFEGQHLDEKAKLQDDDPNAPWHVRHRKLISIVVPVIVVWLFWWPFMAAGGYQPGSDGTSFHLFTDTEDTGSAEGNPRWHMAITMVFGSMIAGSTSEGGAAVAFPVMTLAMGIKPRVARDFSFMIQSTGMVAAAFTIIWMKVKIEWKSVIYVSLGGIMGICVSLKYIVPELLPPYVKMYFVVIWSAFAFALYWVNRLRDRKTYANIPNWEGGVVWRSTSNPEWINVNWKACALLGFGFLGGVFSGMAGSGIDICSFAALTLLFRVSEKTSTPTSVVLMGINTCFGFIYSEFGMGGVEEHAWGYLFCCMPIVVIGAPLGSIIGSHVHRLTLAAMIYVITFAELIGALYIVKPWCMKSESNDCKTDTPTNLCVTSVVMFVGGALFFRVLAICGLKLMNAIEENEAPTVEEPGPIKTSPTNNANTVIGIPESSL